MVVWEGGTQKGGFGGGTLVARRHPCLLAPRYRQPSAGVCAVAALAGAHRGAARTAFRVPLGAMPAAVAYRDNCPHAIQYYKEPSHVD